MSRARKAAIKDKASGRGKNAGPRCFESQAQWRLFFANPRLRRYARKKAHACGASSALTKKLGYSPAYRRLPKRKGGVTAATLKKRKL